jgi:hypothetical protein
MQNVVWPTTSVHVVNGRSNWASVDRSAMPVTMPGSAIGSTTSSDSAFRPKNVAR